VGFVVDELALGHVFGRILRSPFQLNQPTRCSKFSTLLLVIKKQLNVFRASLCPSSGAPTTAVAASGLPSELGGSSAVGRGRAGRRYEQYVWQYELAVIENVVK
jgi:hypothetical protein